jgi:hypothetical protein
LPFEPFTAHGLVWPSHSYHKKTNHECHQRFCKPSDFRIGPRTPLQFQSVVHTAFTQRQSLWDDLYPKGPKRCTRLMSAPKLYANFVNGEFVPAACGETIDVINPATNAVVGCVPRSKREDVDRGVWPARHEFSAVLLAMLRSHGCRFGSISKYME